MPILRIQMLGDFRLLSDDVIVPINQARHQVLLAYPLLHRHALQSRQQLAFLLWPDSSEAQALTNLRKALTHLRQTAAFLAQALCTDHKALQWRPPFLCQCDVADFEEKLAQATKPAPGEDWINTPAHLMLLVPGGFDVAAFTTDYHSGKPYIMWNGTPYEHLMVPVQTSTATK